MGVEVERFGVKSRKGGLEKANCGDVRTLEQSGNGGLRI